MASKMAPDLLNQITNSFGGDTLNRISSAVGVSPAKTLTAVEGLVPAILSGIASKAATVAGANDVIDLIRKNNLTSVDLSDLSSPQGLTNLANTGRSLVDFALGGRASSVTDWIASHAGITRTAVTSLASLCVPAVLGLIGRRLGPAGLSASNLSNLLGGSTNFLHNAPAGLASALGLSGAAAVARPFYDETERPVGAAPAYAADKASSFWKWLLPLLAVAGLIGVFAYLFSRRPATPTVTTQQPAARTEVAPPPVAPAPVAPASTGTNLGAFLDAKLPNGVNLHIPSNGVENKLLAFIQDPSKVVDKETWFSFDRLEFETDSAKLKPSSQEQLANMAAILKAYPQVSLKIGGYTDNTGDPAHNLKLSQDRATSTLNELAALGIPKSRLAAEGYGQQFPVADNATEEGRQRNRRIDIRVTNK